MSQDLSYLNTEYAREKNVECYDIETKARFEEAVDCVEYDLQWAGECLANFRYTDDLKLQRAKGYLENAIKTIDQELERMDDDTVIP